MNKVDPQTYQEWKKSAVADEIINVNVLRVKAGRLWDFMMYSKNLKRLNTGRLSGTLLKRYRQFDNTDAWLVPNNDPVTGKERLYCRAKLELPRIDKDGKVIKYESPPGEPTEPMFLKVTRNIWEQIAKKNNTSLPKDFLSIPDENITGRFWQWAIAHKKIHLWLVEGEKKAACLLSHGVVAISVPGINNWHQVELKKQQGIYKLHLMLEPFAVKGRSFIICFDQDSRIKTRSDVYWATKRLSKCIKSYQCYPFVAHWDGQNGKGIDDYIANGNPLESVNIDTAKKYLGKESNLKLRQLTYPRDLVLNQQYNGDIPMPKSKLIGLKAPKGTGKTELLSQWVMQLISNGYRVLVPTHRTQLGAELSKRLKLPYLSDCADNEETYWESKDIGYILCFDSLRGIAKVPFNADDWIDHDKPYCILLDEVEQSLWHLFYATTSVKDSRVEIMENLQKLALYATHIVASDADLSDVSMDYLAAISHCKSDVSLIENTYQSDGYRCYSYMENAPNRLMTDLVYYIGEGGRHLILTDAQKLKSKTSTSNLEILLRTIYPDKKILKIDSETVVDPSHPAFGCLSHINEIIPHYDVIIASTTIETGVSIDKTIDIDNVWGIFHGVCSTDGVRQFLKRYRGDCDRNIWVAKRGLGFVGNGSPFVKELERSQKEQFCATKHCLKSLIDDFDCVSYDAFAAWLKMASRINYGMINYREQVLDDLAELEGNIVECLQPSPDDPDMIAMGQALKENQETNYDQYNDKTLDSPSVDDIRFQRLKTQNLRTESERLTVRKGETERKYGKVQVTKKLLVADDEGLLPKLKMLYYLTLGREILEVKDSMNIKAQSRNNKIWIPDINNSSKVVPVNILEYFELVVILAMLNNIVEGEFTKDSQLLKDIADKAIKARSVIKNVLKISISENMAKVQIINLLLSRINRKMELLRQERRNGVRVRVYSHPVQLHKIGDDLEREILERWLQSDLALLQNMEGDEGKTVANAPVTA